MDDEEGIGLLEIVFGGIIIYAIFKMLAAFFRLFAEIVIWFFSAWRYEVFKNKDGSEATTWQESKHLIKINLQPLMFIVVVLAVFNINNFSAHKSPVGEAINPVQTATAKGITTNKTIATVNARSLRVREHPSAHAKVIDGLKQNQMVNIVKHNNDWAFIEYKNQQGWVAGKYLRAQ